MKTVFALTVLTMVFSITVSANEQKNSIESGIELLKIDCHYSRVDESIGESVAGYKLEVFINEKVELQKHLPQKLEAVDANGKVLMRLTEKDLFSVGAPTPNREAIGGLYYAEGGDRDRVRLQFNIGTYANVGPRKMDTFVFFVTEHVGSLAQLGFKGHGSVQMAVWDKDSNQTVVIQSSGLLTCTKNLDLK